MNGTITRQTKEVEVSSSWDEVLRWQKQYPLLQPPGFPYKEELPSNRHGEFQIITYKCETQIAHLDLSTQYRAEGVLWRIVGGASIERHQVAAWKRIEESITRKRGDA